MYPGAAFRFALRRIAAVMDAGAHTHQPPGGWWRCTPDYHVARATRHLRLYHEADTSEDHLANATTMHCAAVLEIYNPSGFGFALQTPGNSPKNSALRL
jgi:hypothetical protein